MDILGHYHIEGEAQDGRYNEKSDFEQNLSMIACLLRNHL
jgi:hypothetical protein